MSVNDKEYWDRYWVENSKKISLFNTLVAIARKYYFAKAFAKFINRHYPVKGKTICEIGVGSSLTLGYLKKMGASCCVGLDYSEEAIKIAQKLNKGCEFVLGDAFATELEYNKYDLVYSLGLIEHYTKDQQRALIAEQKRISRECVFIEVPFDVFYFRWLFAINRKLGRNTTFSDEEMFIKDTFRRLNLKGDSRLMPTTFFLTIGHFEYLNNEKDNK